MSWKAILAPLPKAALAFKKEKEAKEDIDIIGQFGVGFYAAFMVADEVKVISRSYQETKPGAGSPRDLRAIRSPQQKKDGHGTDIILKIKKVPTRKTTTNSSTNTGSKVWSKSIPTISATLSKWKRPKTAKEDSDEYESYTEVDTLNSMVPIWRKNKSEISHEDYCQFYKDKFFDYNDPLRVIHSSTEGASTYNALLFIPEKPAFDYYSRTLKKGCSCTPAVF